MILFFKYLKSSLDRDKLSYFDDILTDHLHVISCVSIFVIWFAVNDNRTRCGFSLRAFVSSYRYATLHREICPWLVQYSGCASRWRNLRVAIRICISLFLRTALSSVLIWHIICCVMTSNSLETLQSFSWWESDIRYTQKENAVHEWRKVTCSIVKLS